MARRCADERSANRRARNRNTDRHSHSAPCGHRACPIVACTDDRALFKSLRCMERQPISFNMGSYNTGLIVLAALSGGAAYARSGSIAMAVFGGIGAALAFAVLMCVLHVVNNQRCLSLLGVAHDANRLEEAQYLAGRGLISGNVAYVLVQVSAESLYVRIGDCVRRIEWSGITHIDLQTVHSCTFASIRGVFPRPPGELLLPWSERFNRRVPEWVHISGAQLQR